jgi:hypothetical protein
MGGTIRCGCGQDHGDGSTLAKVGWRPMGDGRARLVAACPCGGKITLSTLDDASFCVTCKRLLHAEVKIAAQSGVYCVGCARRSEHAIPSPIRRYRVEAR